MPLQEMIDNVVATWPFDKKNYKDWYEFWPQDRKMIYALKHILLHQQKALAAIAEVAEKFDHKGGLSPEDEAQIIIAIRKMMLNSLRMVDIAGEQGASLEWWLSHPQSPL